MCLFYSIASLYSGYVSWIFRARSQISSSPESNLLVAGKHIGCSAGAMEPVFIKPEEAGIPIRCLKLQDPAVCRAAESFGYNGRFP